MSAQHIAAVPITAPPDYSNPADNIVEETAAPLSALNQRLARLLQVLKAAGLTPPAQGNNDEGLWSYPPRWAKAEPGLLKELHDQCGFNYIKRTETLYIAQPTSDVPGVISAVVFMPMHTQILLNGSSAISRADRSDMMQRLGERNFYADSVGGIGGFIRPTAFYPIEVKIKDQVVRLPALAIGPDSFIVPFAGDAKPPITSGILVEFQNGGVMVEVRK